MGFFHVQTSVSMAYLFELQMTKHKKQACSVVQFVDALPLIVGCAYLKWVSTNLNYLLLFWTTAHLLCLVIVAVFFPESPKWLLVNNQRQKAIKAFNKMARINGVQHRFAPNSTFLESQLVSGVNSFNGSNDLSYTQQFKDLSMQVFRFKAPNARKDDPSQCMVLFLLVIIFIASYNLYFLNIFMVTRVPGNKYNNGMILGTSEALSPFISLFILKRMHHKACFISLLTYGVLCSIIINFVPLSFFTYLLLLSTLIGISGSANVSFIMIELCVSPSILGAAIELCLCSGIASSLGASIIAQTEMPYPVIVFAFLWFISVIAAAKTPRGNQYLVKVD